MHGPHGGTRHAGGGGGRGEGTRFRNSPPVLIRCITQLASLSPRKETARQLRRDFKADGAHGGLRLNTSSKLWSAPPAFARLMALRIRRHIITTGIAVGMPFTLRHSHQPALDGVS